MSITSPFFLIIGRLHEWTQKVFFSTESAAFVVSGGCFLPGSLALAIAELARIESRHDLKLIHREDIGQSQSFSV